MINKDTQLCMSLSGRPGNFGTTFHNYLYQKLGLNFIYKAFTTTDIESAVKGIRALGIRGCAVSMPFKESCMPFLDEISPSAQAIQSVNTIVNDQGFLRAYNTDYIAIVKLIKEYQLDKNSRVIVRGSGGMAKAVVTAFKNSGFEHLKIFARNEKTGKNLAALYGYEYIYSLDNQSADILVNVTPDDFGSSHPLAGMYFQRKLEEKAFELGGCDYSIPVQRVEDYLENKESKEKIESGKIHLSQRCFEQL